MSRSSWKFYYIDSSILKKVSSMRAKKGKAFSIKTWSRSSTICSDFVNLRFRVHNGK